MNIRGASVEIAARGVPGPKATNLIGGAKQQLNAKSHY